MFNESNTIEQMIIDALCGGAEHVGERRTPYVRKGTTDSLREFGWDYVPANRLQRQSSDGIVEQLVRDALVRLNPEIAEQPDRADEVLYRLRAIHLAVGTDGLVRSNENLASWLRNEKTMPFGANGEHTPVRLIDFDHPENNSFIVTNQYTFSVGELRKRFDVVLLVNGLPLVIGETKTPVRPSESWVDAAHDIHDDYEQSVPAMFVPNVFSFATDGHAYRYGSIRMSVDGWCPWRETTNGGMEDVRETVAAMLRPAVLLDILQNYTIFATDRRHRRIKIICRYQQYEAANLMVKRVVEGQPKKGLIWHFQGSGKSLLMVFAAQKLRMHPDLQNPTVLIVVDRVDLDTQITATFNASDVPNLVTTNSREELRRMLSQDLRKIIITTIHKFGEAGGMLNDRSNIIVMVDEAHRTQEGDLGRKMREALPNAFLFGLTGTPINRRDRNTFYAFGADDDEHGYMSRYSFQDSIRDKATLPLHFSAAEPRLKIDRAAIDEAFEKLTEEISEQDRNEVAKRVRMSVLIKAPERIQGVVEHFVNHYQSKVEPSGLKAQVVTYDRECCVLYKRAMDELLAPEESAIVMHTIGDEYKEFALSKDEEEKLLDRFRDPADPLNFLIVTSKLLTGFDAPILQVMYLDKPLRDHGLLQAICRTNRPYPGKDHGLIVDYIGIFDDVAQALSFDEESVQKVVTNIDELKIELPMAVARCLAFFPKLDRTVGGYEGLIAAQDCLPDNETRDKFAAEYMVLARLWEALSPDACLNAHEQDYRWLTMVYESVKPPSGNGKLLWHALGAKTVELVHRNVHLEAVHDDLETLVMNADVLEELAKDMKKAKIIEIELVARLRKHRSDPRFVALGERLERLKQRQEQGLVTSLEFLKELLAIARDTVEAEKQVDPEDERKKAKAALTDLFAETKTEKTHKMIEQIVDQIDEIVRIVRFDGWQTTSAGQREVQKELRKTLMHFQLHHDQDLFDRAYAYIKEYY